jgi:ribosome biogenesis protein ENP2
MATRDGGIKSTSINGVKVYTIASQQPSLASWLPTKKQQSHRSIKSTILFTFFIVLSLSVFVFSYSFIVYFLLLGYTQNVQLIEDLRFTTATTKIKATPDGEYIIASGTPVWMHLFEVIY